MTPHPATRPGAQEPTVPAPAPPRRDVVVGVDGSDLALHAVAWAATEAALRGTPLRIVHATPRGGARSDEILGRAVGVARRAEPTGVVSAARARMDPVPGLLAAGTGAALLVVGMGGGADAVLGGSVALDVSGRAPCPVAVVRGGPVPPHGPVLVGVDSVEGDAPALALAFSDARRHAGRVAVLHALYGVDASSPPAAERAADVTARERLRTELEPWTARFPGVPVEATVVHDLPARALLRAAEGSRLVVIGTRAQGAYARALFGSTSREVLRRSPTTVTVVNPGAVLTGPDLDARPAARADLLDHPHDHSVLF